MDIRQKMYSLYPDPDVICHTRGNNVGKQGIVDLLCSKAGFTHCNFFALEMRLRNPKKHAAKTCAFF